MSGMTEDGPNRPSVEPGQTKTLEYTFPAEPGELLIGCHEPGRYDGGMVATVPIKERTNARGPHASDSWHPHVGDLPRR